MSHLEDPVSNLGQTVESIIKDESKEDTSTPHLSMVDAQKRSLMQKNTPKLLSDNKELKTFSSSGDMVHESVNPDGQIISDEKESEPTKDSDSKEASFLKPIDDIVEGAPVVSGASNVFAKNIRNPHNSAPIIRATKDDAYISAGIIENTYYW